MALVVDGGETEEGAAGYRKAALGFAHAHHLTMPVLLDIKGDAGNAYKVEAIPTNVIIDPEGIVRYWNEGFDEDAVWKTLNGLGVK